MSEFPPIPADLWKVVSPQLTDARRARMLACASQRTARVRLVLQDVNNAHNVSACMRSADAFGVLNVDVVTLGQKFQTTTTAKGVGNWLRVRRHVNIEGCVEALRKDGVHIACAMPDPQQKSLSELPRDKPLAVLFGNEHAGVSPEWRAHVDSFFTIPMVGMVESLNISVSAAITLYELTKVRDCLGAGEQVELLNEWLAEQLPNWRLLYDRLK
jgi:tRNA (guanosine-2'-O-)-methyltransferase